MLKSKDDLNWINGFEINGQKDITEKDLLLTDTEIKRYREQYIEDYQKALLLFEDKTQLTEFDVSLIMIGAFLQTLRWVILSNDKLRFNKASDADKVFDKVGNCVKKSDYIPATIEQIVLEFANHAVPYDAVQQTDRFKRIYPNLNTGIAGTTHRYKAIGHDPLAGLVFGTVNIATNTLTVNDIYSMLPSYHVVNQKINAKTDIEHVLKWAYELLLENPEIIAASFVHQIVHCSTDVFTRQGLPLPFINTISPETSKLLIGKQVDLYSVSRSTMLSILINKLIEMCHKLYYNPATMTQSLYEIRSMKIILYSNVLSSALNLVYTGIIKDWKKLDIGGLLITLWSLFTNARKINDIKLSFVNNVLDNALKKEEDEVQEQMAKLGFFNL